jgi:1-acyl-sn-glycerol-3-phosphate acyltransferase
VNPDRWYREPFGRSVLRRLWTIPFIFVTFAATTATLPLLVLIALVVDVVRRIGRGKSFIFVRMVFLGWLYAGVEVMAISALFVVWIVSGFGVHRGLETRLTYRLQGWWAGLLFGALRWTFSLGLEVEGDDVVTPGPIVLLVRHASMLDTLIPNALVTRRMGILLRYVLKRELLLDPAIDIAGQRLVNYFLDRRAGDPEAEIARVRRLGEGLGPDEGVLIYPEGTRFTQDKRSRIIEKLTVRSPHLAERAEGLHNTLPPRPGGTLALLDAAPDADVVVMAHVGLDGLATVQHLLNGRVVGGRIRVGFWRVPRSEVPAAESERIDWLFDQWQQVDDWIGTHRLT